MADQKLLEKLIKIQVELKAPKNQFNSFGKYKYRNCEDILEAAKPLCAKYGVLLLISDSVEQVGDRVYVKATATITDGTASMQVSASARESLSRKGMDESQITGTASSYARKYCLGGLFLIDDTKDADSQDNSTQANVITINATEKKTIQGLITETGSELKRILAYVKVSSIDDIPKSKVNEILAILNQKLGAK